MNGLTLTAELNAAGGKLVLVHLIDVMPADVDPG